MDFRYLVWTLHIQVPILKLKLKLEHKIVSPMENYLCNSNIKVAYFFKLYFPSGVSKWKQAFAVGTPNKLLVREFECCCLPCINRDFGFCRNKVNKVNYLNVWAKLNWTQVKSVSRSHWVESTGSCLKPRYTQLSLG